MESILTSIKKMLGISEEYEHFDPDIVMHINSVFMDLTQLGVGPSEGFAIEDDTSVWTDFLPGNSKFDAVKSYIYLRVKILFDPPTSPAVMEAMKREIDKWEWRLNVAAETSNEPGETQQVDYNTLANKPSINGKPLVGNFDEQDPNVKKIESSDIDTIFNEKFNK